MVGTRAPSGPESDGSVTFTLATGIWYCAGVTVTWDILVPTLGERSRLFARLMDVLLPQTEPYGGRVRVSGWFNNGKPGLAEIRQLMVKASAADYVSFVDDDDLVPLYFADEAMKAIDQRPDYVGWQVQCYSDGVPTAVSYHSLAHKRWVNLEDRYLRDISHINPIRRDIALTADFRRAAPGQPEDRAWVHQLRNGGRLRKEVMINRIMYHYLFSTSRTAGIGSRWQAPSKIHPGLARPEIDHPNFTWSA